MVNNVNVCGVFVSQKINKIRWKPDNAAAAGGGASTASSNILVSGSWDDEVRKGKGAHFLSASIIH